MTPPTVFHSTAANRPAAKGRLCDGCGKPIAIAPTGWRATPIVVTELQIDIFRGNDVVRFFHPGCEPTEGKR